MGGRNVVSMHQWVEWLSKDSLAAVLPVAIEFAVISPSGECSKLPKLDAPKPVSSLI